MHGYIHGGSGVYTLDCANTLSLKLLRYTHEWRHYH